LSALVLVLLLWFYNPVYSSIFHCRCIVRDIYIQTDIHTYRPTN
jgi:hypothetical protein